MKNVNSKILVVLAVIGVAHSAADHNWSALGWAGACLFQSLSILIKERYEK